MAWRKMNKYRIKFRTTSSGWLTWERFGKDMEATLKLSKEAIEKEYGNEWTGGIAICGDQSGEGDFCF